MGDSTFQGNAQTCEQNVMVSVCCITYNHAGYIAEAVDGFLNQETTFPFEIIIGDDCSTDGTKEIVLQYQKDSTTSIKIISSEKNVGAKINFLRTIMAAQGKYIAICEGDDYWTNTEKLQKQITFLEHNPEYAMVHSDWGVLYQVSKRSYKSYNKLFKRAIPSGFIYENLLINNLIGTLTTVVRRSVYYEALNKLDLLKKNWSIGDYPTWLEISKHHKIHYIDESLAVYRYLSNSVSHNEDAYERFLFSKNVFNIKFYFIEKYSASPTTIETIKRDYNEMILEHALDLNDKTIMNDYGLFKDVKSNVKIIVHQLGLKNALFRLIVKFCIKIAIYVKYRI